MITKDIRIGVLLMIPSGESPAYAYMESTVRDWLEKAGATIVPILPTISAVEAAAYFEHIHGLFLHEGWADKRDYLDLVTLFLNMAMLANKAGDYFPVWGTCQGMQLMLQHFGGDLERVHSPIGNLVLQPEATNSRLLKGKKQLHSLYFSHECGVLMHRAKQLTATFKILATSHDREGMEYISIVEGRTLPFYGTQFHPDRSSLGWMAVFFIAEAKKSRHHGFDPSGQIKLTRGMCKEEIGSTVCLRVDL
jgi:gamma-glutamyl hydrolase